MFKKVQQLLGAKTARNSLLDMEPETKMDIPGSLPIEVFYIILMYLPSRDVINAWKCCRKWRSRINESWRIKCMFEGYYECEDDLESEFYRKFVAKYSKWEGIYKYNQMLKNNWIKSNFKEIRIDCLARGIKPYKPPLYFCGDIMIVTCRNNKILVLDCTTGFVKQEFFLPGPQHDAICQAGKFENRLIFVSERTSNGRTILHITIWNIETGDSLTEFHIEMEKMAEIEILFYKDRLVTVISNLDIANVINLKEQKLDYRRNGVKSICHCDDIIAMGTNVGTIIVMNLDYTELMILNCSEIDRSIDEIQIKGKYLVGFSRNQNEETENKAYVFNIETKTKLYEVEELWKYGFRMYLNENILVYASSKPKVYDPKLNHCHLDSGEKICKRYKKSVIWYSNDFFILEEYLRCGLFKLLSIKSGKNMGWLELPERKSDYFDFIWKTKSKIAYYPSSCYLKIINFEAATEIL